MNMNNERPPCYHNLLNFYDIQKLNRTVTKKSSKNIITSIRRNISDITVRIYQRKGNKGGCTLAPFLEDRSRDEVQRYYPYEKVVVKVVVRNGGYFCLTNCVEKDGA